MLYLCCGHPDILAGQKSATRTQTLIIRASPERVEDGAVPDGPTETSGVVSEVSSAQRELDRATLGAEVDILSRQELTEQQDVITESFTEEVCCLVLLFLLPYEVASSIKYAVYKKKES